MATKKMICPECNIEMNHHTDKIDYDVPEAKARLIDPDFGGIIQEAHSCPQCGITSLREATRA